MAQDLAANLKELRVIASVVPLSITKLLDVSDRAKLLAAAERYQVFKEGEIRDLWYQKKIVRDACRKKAGAYSYQLPPGAGKTYPAADISARFQKHGKTIYVCPNTAAMGDESSGIIQKFHRMYKRCGIKARIGRVNETTTLNDVHFFTPASLLGLRSLQKSLFDRIVEEAAIIVLDEAHHFMDEMDGRHKIFGEIPKVAKTYFEKTGKKTVIFTATYGRLDGKPLIVRTPDFKLTVQDVVNEGRCPEIHAMQIFLPFKCPKARDSKSDYDLKLEGKEYEEYWRTVAGVILETYKSNPAPFATFVRLQTEAEYLAQIFNHSSGLGDRGMGVMTAHTTMAERLRIIDQINNGKLAGYVTCGVGEEAIDIPKIEVIHFVKRTKSDIKLMQAIGRSLRIAAGKKRALFVDYQIMKESVLRACNGIVRLANICGLDPKEIMKRPNGGAIVAIEGSKSAIIPGAETFGETEALIIKQLLLETSPGEKRKEILFRLASSGAERPTDTSMGEFQGEKLVGLAHLYYKVNNSNSKHYDPAFLTRIHEIPHLHPSWKTLRKDRMKEREEELIRLGSTGAPRPSWKGPQHVLAYSLQAWTSKVDPKYKPEFDAKIRRVASRWFKPLYIRRENPIDVFVPDTETVIKDFQKPLKDISTPVPKGHWLETGFYVNASRGYSSSDRYSVEKAILAALEKGPFPEPKESSWRDTPEEFFIQGETAFRKGGYDENRTYQVPLVWEYSDLIDGIEHYTNRHKTGWGRRYHSSFSFYLKVRFPDCPYITPLCYSRGSTLGSESGLSPWEKWLKWKEALFFQNFDELCEAEQQRQTIMFALMDSEFAHEVSGSFYKNDFFVDGEYGLFARKDQSTYVSDIIEKLPQRAGRDYSERSISRNNLERSYCSFHLTLEKTNVESAGGRGVIDQVISNMLSFGELEAPQANKFNRVEFRKLPISGEVDKLKKDLEAVVKIMTNPEEAFRHQALMESFGRGRSW